MLVCTEDYAERHGLTPLARVRSRGGVGLRAGDHGHRPGRRHAKALARAGIDGRRDLDVVELNEAFAQPGARLHRATSASTRRRVNLDGGAIALGHPLGATGARIVGKAAALLQREGGRYALATQCIGGGQGIATVLERV